MSQTITKSSATSSQRNWDDILKLAETILNATLAKMRVAHARGDLEQALQWAQTAASFIVFGGTFGRLASAELEQIGLSIAKTLPTPTRASRPAGKLRFLHVFTEAYELFGHTKLCRKWIELDPSAAQHDVAFVDQYDSAPTNLRQSVEARGGKLTRLDRTKPMLERALQLRKLAYAEADVVVLHIHPNDTLPNVAFGIPGGPPVVYVNHADHEFWIGGATADLVLDIRESGQEWTRDLRDIPRTEILPIPLEQDPLLLAGADKVATLRAEIRKQHGIADDELLLLTIGSARKYEPMLGLSFLEAAETILKRCPKAKLLAVGPRATGEWEAVSKRVGGRLLAIGNQSELGRFHAAADLYLEGMPAGSLTALLEVCLAGLACVRAPIQVRPPHASDGSALAPVPQPVNVSAYVDEAVALANDGTKRQERANRLQGLVRDTHCETGWSKLLGRIVAELPQIHAIFPQQNPKPIDRTETIFKLEYAYRQVEKAYGGLLATFVQQAVRYSQEARSKAERALPSLVKAGEESDFDAAALLIAILPELKPVLSESGTGQRASLLKTAPMARWLIQRAAEDGRRFSAWRLGAGLATRTPALWRNAEFRTGLARSLPGMLTLTEMIKARRA